jgi:TRAP-type C4-dicarboxylate transport system permease large subunit
MLGLITPPVGGLLFVESKLAKVSFDRLSKAVVPFILSLLVILMLITYLPALVTWLPNLIFS